MWEPHPTVDGSRGTIPATTCTPLLEVITDEGVTGLGSVFTSARLVSGSLALLRPMLIGESIEPARVAEKLHQATFWQGRGGAVTHAISGIDIALWDLFGKVTAQPISRLLGGRYRERIKPYGSLIMAEPDELKPRITSRGGPGIPRDQDGLGTVRSRVGNARRKHRQNRPREPSARMSS